MSFFEVLALRREKLVNVWRQHLVLRLHQQHSYARMRKEDARNSESRPHSTTIDKRTKGLLLQGDNAVVDMATTIPRR